MTFSLVARDPATGAFGMVICSSSPAVASRCAHIRATVGVVASQNVTNPALGPRVLDSLAGGSDAHSALKAALAHEQFPDYRQLTVVDVNGNTAVRSGPRSLGVHTHAQGDQAVAAEQPPQRREGDLRAADRLRRQRRGRFEERLLDGLRAALAAGGEAGPVHSAGLVVVEDVPWPVTDLRVDYADDPIGDLAELWQLWKPQKTTTGSVAWTPPAHRPTACRGRDHHRHRDSRGCRRRPPAADPTVPRPVRPPRNRVGRGALAQRVAGQLSDNGFHVTQRYCDIDTAFAAQIGSGDLHIALCAEYDALPGLGHACGHNLISAITVGAALALAPVVDDLGLTLTVIGTPAEEGAARSSCWSAMDSADSTLPQWSTRPRRRGPGTTVAVSHSHIEYRGSPPTPPPTGARHQRGRRVHHRTGRDRTAASATAFIGASAA